MKVNTLAHIAYEAHHTALSWAILKTPHKMENLINYWLSDAKRPSDFTLSLANYDSYWEIWVLMSWWLDSIACYLRAMTKS